VESSCEFGIEPEGSIDCLDNVGSQAYRPARPVLLASVPCSVKADHDYS
jgi:hypothetical protein